MATRAYLCKECGTTFEIEGGCCCQPDETATCPKCGDLGAKKQPVAAAKPAGGCGCGGSSCC